MEDEILNLINDYNRKVNWLKTADKPDEITRMMIADKINCYKKFIAELEMIVNEKC
jgi:hypothetical protein